MHIHGNSMPMNPATFYSAAGAEKAAAERAAETRKRLLKNASEIGNATSCYEDSLVSHWVSPPKGEVEAQSE